MTCYQRKYVPRIQDKFGYTQKLTPMTKYDWTVFCNISVISAIFSLPELIACHISFYIKKLFVIYFIYICTCISYLIVFFPYVFKVMWCRPFFLVQYHFEVQYRRNIVLVLIMWSVQSLEYTLVEQINK